LKIKRTDKISNEEVLRQIKEDELCLYGSIQKQKMAFTGHVLTGSSGEDALQILEGKLEEQNDDGRQIPSQPLSTARELLPHTVIAIHKVYNILTSR